MFLQQTCLQNILITVFEDFCEEVQNKEHIGWKYTEADTGAVLTYKHNGVSAVISVKSYTENELHRSISFRGQLDTGNLVLQTQLNTGKTSRGTIYDDHEFFKFISKVESSNPCKYISQIRQHGRVSIDAGDVDFKPFIVQKHY